MAIKESNKYRLNRNTMAFMLEMSSKQLHFFTSKDLEKPGQIYSLVLENENNLTLGLENLFYRLLICCPIVFNSFKSNVARVREVKLVFDKCCTYIQFGNRMKINFTRSSFLVLFINLVKPFFNSVQFYDTHFFRQALIKVCKALVDNECIMDDTYLRFMKLNNDNAYGTIQEILRDHVRYIEIDEEFSTYLTKSGTFKEIVVNAKTNHELYYLNGFFKLPTERLIIPQVAGIRNFQDFENVPVSESVHSLEIAYSPNDSEEVHKTAIADLKKVVPNLKELVLTCFTGINVENAVDPSVITQEVERVKDDLTRKNLEQLYSELNLNKLAFKHEIYVRSKDKSIHPLDQIARSLELRKEAEEEEFHTYKSNKEGQKIEYLLYSTAKEHYPFRVHEELTV
ncbi:unnamed protein product [Bursaphelenchus okinawaensis]|uniref:Uncharacterized protein n=1 Tax=Bursaphelenchus okinawaensis TaxID=465554 RepID=A0A811KJW4_9BILA|nr:unnamed protein product [Bursaphelenchus okinawaensis]CAG9105237.1 unnamed protein product [Bursaphelenchus okinawaensis]